MLNYGLNYTIDIIHLKKLVFKLLYYIKFNIILIYIILDMFQVSILEFKDRPDKPLFHLEHYIDGKYIKYNSNSGFVEDVQARNTPQAFSHFTFERSNHELIVVDVQGVGDLYTDPQIHTFKGTEYGEGNLGIKGFALFFSSHICNDVCRSLGKLIF